MLDEKIVSSSTSVIGIKNELRFTNNIYGLYIFDSTGTILYNYNNLNGNSEKINQEIVSGLVSALQYFAQQIGEKQINVIDLGSKKIYSTKDLLTNITFSIACDNEVKSKKILSLLKEIKNFFTEKFMGRFHSREELKTKITETFQEELDKTLLKANTIEYFLKAM